MSPGFAACLLGKACTHNQELLCSRPKTPTTPHQHSRGRKLQYSVEIKYMFQGCSQAKEDMWPLCELIGNVPRLAKGDIERSGDTPGHLLHHYDFIEIDIIRFLLTHSVEEGAWKRFLLSFSDVSEWYCRWPAARTTSAQASRRQQLRVAHLLGTE